MPSPDPNATRKPGQPFVYKRAAALDAADPTLEERLLLFGQHNLSVRETAAGLGVSQDTLSRFWAEHPLFREAWDRGKELRKGRLRVLGDRHAITDPSTWRFLAKNELNMSDDPAKAELDREGTKALRGMGRDEVNNRLVELQAKLIGQGPITEGVSRETKQGSEEVLAGPRQAGRGQAGQRQGVDPQLQPAADGAGNGRGDAQGPGGGRHGGDAERLEARLEALERSAVRKAPRKDGQAHTDRTKPVDGSANKPQERPSHIPPRLADRIGRK